MNYDYRHIAAPLVLPSPREVIDQLCIMCYTALDTRMCSALGSESVAKYWDGFGMQWELFEIEELIKLNTNRDKTW